MYLRVKFLFVLTPSPCGHSPYILLRKTQGGEGEMYIPFASASMLFKTTRHVAEYGRGGERGLKSTSNIFRLLHCCAP